MTLPPEQPSDRPFKRGDGHEDYWIVIEGPMDKTRRPRRAGVPYTPPDAPLSNPTLGEAPQEQKDESGDAPAA
jgi:hypothetical protein